MGGLGGQNCSMLVSPPWYLGRMGKSAGENQASAARTLLGENNKCPDAIVDTEHSRSSHQLKQQKAVRLLTMNNTLMNQNQRLACTRNAALWFESTGVKLRPQKHTPPWRKMDGRMYVCLYKRPFDHEKPLRQRVFYLTPWLVLDGKLNPTQRFSRPAS